MLNIFYISVFGTPKGSAAIWISLKYFYFPHQFCIFGRLSSTRKSLNFLLKSMISINQWKCI